MNATYYFGLLLLVFGGFLALVSTGLPSGIGVGTLFIGLLIGTIGVLESGLP